MSRALVRSNFLDSGAFSVWKKAIRWAKENGCDLADYYDTEEFYAFMDGYADFVKKYQIAIDRYATVDALFQPEISYRNQRYLEKKHGLRPVPVVHYQSDLKWLEKYIARGHSLIGIGGLARSVHGSQNGPRNWLDKVFDYVCDNPERIPCVRLHGFGFTSFRMITRYPWYCMPVEKHKVLTKSGWKGFEDLKMGQEIMAYNDGNMEWQKILEIPSFDVKNVDLIHLYNGTMKGVDSYTTWNHRWRTAYRDDKTRFRWRETHELCKTDIIPRSGVYQSAPKRKTYSNDFVELVAWFWTEGHLKKSARYKKPSIVIYQSETANPEKVDRIRHCLARLDEAYCEITSKRGKRAGNRNKSVEKSFELYGKNRDRLLDLFPKKILNNQFILSLTVEQLELFIQVSVLADGSTQRMIGGESEQTYLTQTGRNRRNLKYFQLAAILAGYVTSRTRCKIEKEDKKKSVVRICKSPTNGYARVKSMKKEVERYTGKLWCVRVESGAFLTKCNGCIFVTGNSIDSSVWSQAAGYGNMYIPHKRGGRFVFNLPPYTKKVTENCKGRAQRGHHIKTLRPHEQRIVQEWLDFIGVPYGSETVEGTSNSTNMRRKANLLYFQMLADAQPPWPWRFESRPVKRTLSYDIGRKT